MTAAPVRLRAKVTVSDLTAGSRYVLYRYAGFNAFPAKEFDASYDRKVDFTPNAGTWAEFYVQAAMLLTKGGVCGVLLVSRSGRAARDEQRAELQLAPMSVTMG